MIPENVVKVMGVMTKVWDYQPTENMEADWNRYATWLAQAIETGMPRADMDAYMSRVQAVMRIGGSMAFRKIVDRSIEVLAAPPAPAEASRIEKLNPTAA